MKIEEILYKVTDEARQWLELTGLSLEILTDRPPREYGVGEYETKSVFTGTIQIRVGLYEIMKMSNPEELQADVRVTVFHEIGHALMEWLNELSDEEIEPYKEEYFDIFYDDNGVDEEDIVEEFGESFDDTNIVIDGHSLLRELVELMVENEVEFINKETI